MKHTRLVAATRLSEHDFWRQSLLGQSLLAIPDQLRPELALRFDNTGDRCEGLSKVYNRAIEDCPDHRHLLLVHDDVYLHDIFIEQRIAEGLREHDVIGLAGSRGGELGEPSWALSFDANLDGIGWQEDPTVQRGGFVSHATGSSTHALNGTPPPVRLSGYGETPMRCDLLDGLFLALDTNVIRANDVRFDERFDFHFYDLDFCRSVLKARLWLSTWPILVTHGSGGAFGTPAWKQAARLYLDKWDCPHVSRATIAASA